MVFAGFSPFSPLSPLFLRLFTPYFAAITPRCHSLRRRDDAASLLFIDIFRYRAMLRFALYSIIFMPPL
jgi:hypothetical protein